MSQPSCESLIALDHHPDIKATHAPQVHPQHVSPSLSSSLSSDSSTTFMPESPVILTGYPSRRPPLQKHCIRHSIACPSTKNSSVTSPPRREGAPQLPQRSASAGALIRHPGLSRHSSHVSCPMDTTSCQYPSDPDVHRAVDSRRVSFSERVGMIPSTDSRWPRYLAETETRAGQLWWDESQLAMELADDHVLDKHLERNTPARRIQQKISSIFGTSSRILTTTSSSKVDHTLKDANSPLSLCISTATIPDRRFIRTLKKLKDFV